MKDTIHIDGARYSATQLREIIAKAAATLRALIPEGELEELLRRDQVRNVVDGWPSGGGSEVRSPDVARPTENTALRLADPEQRAAQDPVHEHVEQIIRATLALAGHAGIIELRTKALADRHGRVGRVDTTGSCEACERTVACTSADPLVSGFCASCRKAWERSGYIDRSEFVRTRRAKLERKAS